MSHSFEKVDRLHSLTNDLRHAVQLYNSLENCQIDRVTVYFSGRGGSSLTEVNIYDADIISTIDERLRTKSRAILECMETLTIPRTAAELLAMRGKEADKSTHNKKGVN